MFMYSQGDSETIFTISHSANSKDGGFTGPHPRPHLLLSILLVTGFLEAVRLWDPMVLSLMTNDSKHAFMCRNVKTQLAGFLCVHLFLFDLGVCLLNWCIIQALYILMLDTYQIYDWKLCPLILWIFFSVSFFN